MSRSPRPRRSWSQTSRDKPVSSFERRTDAGAVAHDRGAEDLAAAPRDRAGRGASQARAESARRRPATARGVDGEARPARAPRRAGSGASGTIAAQLQGDATEALEELRDLARGITRRCWPTRGWWRARVAGAQVGGAGRDPGERGRAVRARGRGGRLLLVPGSAAERREVRLGFARVSLSDGDGRLRFRVADDGVGFDASSSTAGTGLQGIADRLAPWTASSRSARAGSGDNAAGSLPVAG